MKRLSMINSGFKQEPLQLELVELEPVCRNGVDCPPGAGVAWLCPSSFSLQIMGDGAVSKTPPALV